MNCFFFLWTESELSNLLIKVNFLASLSPHLETPQDLRQPGDYKTSDSGGVLALLRKDMHWPNDNKLLGMAGMQPKSGRPNQ